MKLGAEEWKEIFHSMNSEQLVNLWNFFLVTVDDDAPDRPTESPIRYILPFDSDGDASLVMVRWFERSGEDDVKQMDTTLLDAVYHAVDIDVLASFLSTLDTTPKEALKWAEDAVFYFESHR